MYWDAMAELFGEVDDELIPGKFAVRINTMLAGWPNLAQIVLLHEMAHIAVWPDETHGAAWDKEMRRLCRFKSYRKLL